jgi:hypothetical protein
VAEVDVALLVVQNGVDGPGPEKRHVFNSF